MILQKLKQQTRSYHETIERDMDVVYRIHSVEEYRVLLQKFWGFYDPIETKLAAMNEWNDLNFDFEQRRKAPLLLDDLQVLGGFDRSSHQLPRCTDTPQVNTFLQALGCMYVLEGSTLGGQIIARQIHETLGFDEKHGCTFYNSYGHDVGPMWKAFGSFLDEYVTHVADDVESVLIQSACETFLTLGRWILKGEQ